MPASCKFKPVCAPNEGSPVAVTVTVGTAGHVDHGKTSLVKALTGYDTDRLPEEKARGMTIDLGIARCDLPNNRRVGIIDVPGHERFINNMVAGATEIGVLLLVVAADDGVMPQTVEHFHIACLLGIKNGLVAITKVDLVDSLHAQVVKAQIEELISGSFLENCPIVPVSSKTGEGLDILYDALANTIDRTEKHDPSGPFRLYIERAFVLQGRGLIVSGVPFSGAVRVGDTLQLWPSKSLKRVRSIQVYGKQAEQGRAGERVALNIAALTSDEAMRGAVLATPDYFDATRLINAMFRFLPQATAPLKPRTAIRFHIGTANVPGHLVLPTLTPLLPDHESYVQIQLAEPVVAAPGDPFLIRRLSPVLTLGGGRVIAPDNVRIRRSKVSDWLKACEEKERAFKDPMSTIDYCLKHLPPTPVKSCDIARAALMTEETLQGYLRKMVQAGSVFDLGGDHYVHVRHLEQIREKMVQVLEALHRGRPLSLGFAKKEILAGMNANRALFENALQQLVDAGRVVSDRAGFQLPSLKPALSEAQRDLAMRVCDLFDKTGLLAPGPDDLPAALRAQPPEFEPLLAYLVQKGELIQLAPKVFLHHKHVESAMQKLIEYLKKHGSITVATFRDVLGTSRKYAVSLLEYWDQQELTRRIGNDRVLTEKSTNSDRVS